MIRFSASIRIRGVNPYILVTKEQVVKVKPGWKKPMPVLVTVNGKPNPPWNINMMPVGDGNFYLYLHGVVRKSSNAKVGDTVEITIKFDKSYQNGPLHPMPDWFARVLDSNAVASKNWEALSPSRQKEILRYFHNLRSEEAQKRNLERVMNVLSGKRERFMGRLWSEGK